MRLARLNAAIQRAIDFLAAARDEHSWWSDFLLAAGWSDEWVTGYTAAALAKVAPDLAFDAWTLLKTRRTDQSGWGFNARTPLDGDSTLWALRLAAALGQQSDARYLRALTFLQSHLTPEGGLTTYASEAPIRSFIQCPWYFPMWGWVNHPHPCVTAAGAGLPDLRAVLIPYLRNVQTQNGHWPAYWWCDAEYSTAQAAEALAAQADPADRERIRRAVAWASSQAPAQAIPPFVAAWYVRLFLAGNDPDSAVNIASQLIDVQASDGSWQGTARLRLPIPGDKNPDIYTEWQVGKRSEGGINLDEHRVFTTATVIAALHKIIDFI